MSSARLNKLAVKIDSSLPETCGVSEIDEPGVLHVGPQGRLRELFSDIYYTDDGAGEEELSLDSLVLNAPGADANELNQDRLLEMRLRGLESELKPLGFTMEVDSNRDGLRISFVRPHTQYEKVVDTLREAITKINISANRIVLSNLQQETDLEKAKAKRPEETEEL